MDNEEDQRIIKYTMTSGTTKGVILPVMKQLKFDKVSEIVTPELENFFKSCIPRSVQSFVFNWDHQNTIDMKNYTDLIVPIIRKTTKEVYLKSPTVDYDDFSKIVQASKNSQRLVFDGLTLIKSGKINFGRDLNYNITYFGLHGTDEKESAEWSEDKNELKNLVREIRLSNMKKHLQTFNVRVCSATKANFASIGIDALVEDLHPLEV